MNIADWSLAYARLLLESFIKAGLRHVCISPGARSTPLSLAAFRDERLVTHIVLDERSAGFVALGIAKASGTVAAVVCTSGTAAANYLPAVIEASHTETPLVVLTADRPPSLRGTGANQTIDQRGLYNAFVRYEAHTPLPVDPASDPDAHRAWTEIGMTAAARCASGPVHINVAFEEPLVPTGDPVSLPDSDFVSIDAPSAPHEAEPFDVEGNGFVVIGGNPVHDALAIARRHAWPVFAEPQSGMRVPGTISTAPWLFADKMFSSRHRPDVLLRFGQAPTSRSTLEFVGSAERVLVGDQAAAAQSRNGTHAWLETWTRADALARRAIDALIDEWDLPFHGRVARDLAAALPDGSDLCVGSSMPVRELDAFMAPRTGIRVIANRGASGIDGFCSTVLGVSINGNPTFALLGDLTFLHDAGGLIWNARKAPPATFVVINDDGGGIFSFVAQSALPEAIALFTTPHGIDLAEVARAAGCSHERVGKASDLISLLKTPDTQRSRVIEVLIDRNDTVKRHRMIAEAVAETLRTL